MNSKFEVSFLGEAREFLLELDGKAETKILYNIDKSRILNDPKLFKKLTDTIWEFRTRYNGLQFRLLAFWDKTEKMKAIVISTHGFSKKTEKVPQHEIDKADQIRQLYFDQKREK